MMAGREKRVLGDAFGLTNYGVNLTRIKPGGMSALRHAHAKQDEFVYIISGTPILVLADKEYPLRAGDCCGFKAGTGVGHQLVNRSASPVLYLEIGDRTPGDEASYPDDDLRAELAATGVYRFTRKDGSSY